jgi:SAM-dependent methyltransferase
MLLEEARWLNRHLSKLSPNDLYPMCNIGSSTAHYRQVEQPYIEKYLFEPARIRNLKVIHVDAKPAAGIDVVGDLTDPSFLAHLAEHNVRSVMCCNLLEHVTDRAVVSDAVLSILKPGGYLIVTVPYRFPYHADPIDTMYRPTVQELLALFAGTSLHKAAVVRGSRFAYEMHGNYRALCRMVARATVPFYRPRRWWATLQRLAEIVSGYKVTCVILRKNLESLDNKSQCRPMQAH